MTQQDLKNRFGIDKPLSAMPFAKIVLSETDPFDSHSGLHKLGLYYEFLSTPLTEQILKEVFGIIKRVHRSTWFEIACGHYVFIYSLEYSELGIKGRETYPKVETVNDLLSAAEKENIQLELKN